MRTQIISPEIGVSQYESDIDNNGLIKKQTGMIFPNTTSAIFDGNYNSGLHYSMNIFTEISKFFSVDAISDFSVKAKVLQILDALNKAMMNIPAISGIERYLSKLHLIEQEDKSILIEWIYQNFRIGFVVCKPVEDSYYFFVSQGDDSFVSKSVKVGDNINALAYTLVQYVIEST